MVLTAVAFYHRVAAGCQMGVGEGLGEATAKNLHGLASVTVVLAVHNRQGGAARVRFTGGLLALWAPPGWGVKIPQG
jgi:hypothetical protein